MLLGALMAGAAGCGWSDGHSCTLNPGVGLVLTVVNGQTGQPICDAVVTAQRESDTTSWELSVGPDCTYRGSGVTALVRAERTGFTSATQLIQVRSTGGECPFAEAAYATIRLMPTD